jgi:hypothetical protein
MSRRECIQDGAVQGKEAVRETTASALLQAGCLVLLRQRAYNP